MNSSAPAPDASRDRAGVYAAAVVLATLVVLLATRGQGAPIGAGYDDAIYVDLARSLAAGGGYRHGYLPGHPVAVHYPPLFPVWLALWGAAGATVREPSWWLSSGNALLTAAAAGVWTLWGVRALRLPAWLAGVAAAGSLLVYPARVLSSLLFSEPLGWLLLGGAALAELRARSPWARAALAGLLPLARTILLPFPAMLALLGVRDDRLTTRRRIVLVLVALAPTVAWMAYTARHGDAVPGAWAGSYGSYTRMYARGGFALADVASIAGLQLATLLSLAREMFTLGGAVVVIACLAMGLVAVRRAQPWLAWGTLGYVALVLVWPFTPERFLWGLLPLLALMTAAGARAIVARAGARAPAWRVASIAALAAPFVFYGAATVRAYPARAWLAPLAAVGERNAPLVRWGRTLAPGAPVATETDGLFALATGLATFPIVTPDPADKLGRGLPMRARVEESLCTVGDGWVALTGLTSDVADGVREIARDTTSLVRLGRPQQVGGGAVVARFSCRTR
jgi:hypothetical protein